MIMGGIVLTMMTIWYTYIVAFSTLNPQMAEVRMNTLNIGLWAHYGLIGVVIVALAFGKPEHIKFKSGTVDAEIDFDGDEPQHHEEDSDHVEDHAEDTEDHDETADKTK